MRCGGSSRTLTSNLAFSFVEQIDYFKHIGIIIIPAQKYWLFCNILLCCTVNIQHKH